MRPLIAAVASWALAATTFGAEAPPARFTDITERAGIRFRHSIGDYDLSNIVEGTGPGATFFDADGDGDLDLYLSSGCWNPDVNDNRGRRLRGRLTNALYRNNGDGTFTDVTREAGVGDTGYGMSASAEDYDGDGDLDLYVLNYGPNVLYRNDGDGTFTDVTKEAGVAGRSWSLSAPWLDHDGDGDLDLFVANYLEYDKGKFRDYYPAKGYPGPLSYAGQQDSLYRNNGDGTFTDVTLEAGLRHPNGRSMSAVAFDADDDGDADVFVTNDAMPNSLWINEGDGKFEERAMEFGVAFGEGGQGASSMGPAVGDVDRNGLLDILVPDMGYGCMLFQTNPGEFVDVTARTGLALICGQYTGWGGVLADLENDGYLDAFIANGNAHHLFPEEDVLVRFDGKSRFLDVAKSSGDYFRRKYVGRGSSFADIDDDGDIDIVVMNINDLPRLLRNDGGNRRSWIKIVPRRRAGGAIATGARVAVIVGSRRMVQPAISVNGYLAGNDPRPHFGLGDADRVDLIEVRWPDGSRTRRQDIPARQILEVVQGE